MSTPTLFIVTVDDIPFEIHELNDHLVATQDGRPILVCNVEDDIESLLAIHLHANI